MFDEKYDNMYALLDNESRARRYFSSLPQYVRDNVCHQSKRLTSYSALREYAEALINGD